MHDFGGALKVGVCDVEGDDVDSFSYAEDVAAVGRVPERGVVAKMGLIREEHGESDLVWGRR